MASANEKKSTSGRKRYKGFLSYAHADTREEAVWLRRELERFRVPWFLVRNKGAPRRLLWIFRDRDDLRVGPDIDEKIEDALKASEHLIVLCSTKSTDSNSWVNQEIAKYKSLGRAKRIIPVISKSVGEELGPDDIFPPALRLQVTPEGDVTDVPEEKQFIAADLRPAGDDLPDGLLKVVTALLPDEIKFDELRRRERKAARRRLMFGWFVAMAVLTLGLGVLYLGNKIDNAAISMIDELVVPAVEEFSEDYWHLSLRAEETKKLVARMEKQIDVASTLKRNNPKILNAQVGLYVALARVKRRISEDTPGAEAAVSAAEVLLPKVSDKKRLAQVHGERGELSLLGCDTNGARESFRQRLNMASAGKACAYGKDDATYVELAWQEYVAVENLARVLALEGDFLAIESDAKATRDGLLENARNVRLAALKKFGENVELIDALIRYVDDQQTKDNQPTPEKYRDRRCDFQRDKSVALNQMAELLGKLNMRDRQISHYESSLKISRAVAQCQPDNRRVERDISFTLTRLAAATLKKRIYTAPNEQLENETNPVAKYYEESVRISQRLTEYDSLSETFRSDLLAAQQGLSASKDRQSAILLGNGDAHEALRRVHRDISAAREYARMEQPHCRHDPSSPQCGHELADAQTKLSDSLTQLSGMSIDRCNAKSALRLIRPSIEMAFHLDTVVQKRCDDTPFSTECRDDLAIAQRKLSWSLAKISGMFLEQGDALDALRLVLRSTAIARDLTTRRTDDDDYYQQHLSIILTYLGDAQRSADKFEEAQASYKEALLVAEKLVEKEPENGSYQGNVNYAACVLRHAKNLKPWDKNECE